MHVDPAVDSLAYSGATAHPAKYESSITPERLFRARSEVSATTP
jgi:hypothetical protein